jgi:hypothetical protein
MSDLQRYNGGSSLATTPLGLSGSWSRPGRAVARIVSGAELATVQAAAQAHVEQARLDAIDTVAGRALQGVAMVTAMEQQLSTTIPFAASRLQAIADMHALVVSNEVATFARRL